MSYTGKQPCLGCLHDVVYGFPEFLLLLLCLFKGQHRFLLHFDLETYLIPQQVRLQLGQIV